MPRKRFSAEQIVNKLREADVLLSKGQTIAQACKQIGVTDQTYYRWRREYGGLKVDQAKRLKALEIVRLAARHPQLPCNRFIEEISKSTMSHHWRVLREAGLIRQVGEGTSRLNSLRREELDKRFPGMLDFVLLDNK